MKERDLATAIEDYRVHFDALTARNFLRRATRNIDAPQMTSVDIVLVRGEDYERSIWRKGRAINFEISRRQRNDRAASGGNRIGCVPSPSFPQAGWTVCANDTAGRASVLLIWAPFSADVNSEIGNKGDLRD